MSVNVSLLAEVDAAFRAAKSLPHTYALTEADYAALEACHAKWVKAGGLGRLPTGKEAPTRIVFTITSNKQRASYIYKDKLRQITPPSMLPEVLGFLGEAAAATTTTARRKH